MPRSSLLRSAAILALLAGGTTVQAACTKPLSVPGTFAFRAPAPERGAAEHISKTTQLANAPATAGAK